MIKKVKNTVPWIYIISDYNREELVGISYGKNATGIDTSDFAKKTDLAKNLM